MVEIRGGASGARRPVLELPVTIYRPGIIVGDSRTGYTSRFHGIYQILRAIHYGLVDSLPCQSEFQLDITPVDYVSDAIVRLARLDSSTNKTFHLTAGPGNTLSLGELVEIYLRADAGRPGARSVPAGCGFCLIRMIPTERIVWRGTSGDALRTICPM